MNAKIIIGTDHNAVVFFHRVLWLVVAMGLVAGVSGCVRPPHDRTPDGRVIVQYWEKWTGFEGDAMRAVVDDFNASQTNIFVDMLSVSQIDRKLMLATAGGNPPDVGGLWSYAVSMYSEKGALMPLNKMLAEAGITRDHYIPVFWELCNNKGFVWALPSTPATMAIHWNKKSFRDAGLDPDKPPRSMAELDKMAEQLTVVDILRDGKKTRVRYPDLTDEEKGKKEYDIVKLGYSPAEPGWYNSMWGYWFGAELWDGERTIQADSPENVAALEWYQSYPKKYGLNNMRTFGSSFGNFSSPQNPFLEGRIAMVLQGVWLYNFISKYSPDLEWGVASFPSVDPEKYPAVTIAECDILVIPKGARHPKEAFEFIKYVNSQGPMEKLCRGQRKFSPLAVTSEEFIQTHPNPYIQKFIELAKSVNAKHVPKLPVWNVYTDEMGVAYGQAFDLLKTAREALDDVQKRVQWKFDRVLRRWDKVGEERLKEWSQ